MSAPSGTLHVTPGKSQKPLVVKRHLESRPRPIDQTPGIPGSDKNKWKQTQK